jgi:hypothetical protein
MNENPNTLGAASQAFSDAVSEQNPVRHFAQPALIGNVLPDLSRPNNNVTGGNRRSTPERAKGHATQ